MAREGGAAPEATDPGDLADELGRGQRVREALSAVLARSGLPEITIHDLRQSQATIAAALGVRPHVIEANLGLTDISLTMNVIRTSARRRRETPPTVSMRCSGVLPEPCGYILGYTPTDHRRSDGHPVFASRVGSGADTRI